MTMKQWVAALHLLRLRYGPDMPWRLVVRNRDITCDSFLNKKPTQFRKLRVAAQLRSVRA